MDEPKGGKVKGTTVSTQVEPGDSQPNAATSKPAAADHVAAKGIPSTRRIPYSDGEPFQVDRSGLEAILNVSSRLSDIQMRSKMTMSALSQGNKTYKDKQVNKQNN